MRVSNATIVNMTWLIYFRNHKSILIAIALTFFNTTFSFSEETESKKTVLIAENAPRSFLVFRAWNYPNAPSPSELEKLGITTRNPTLRIAYQYELFDEYQHEHGYAEPATDYLRNELVPKWLKSEKPMFDHLHLDIEVGSWMIDPSREKDHDKLEKAKQKFINVLAVLRDTLPIGTKIGFYNIVATLQNDINKRSLSLYEKDKWQSNNNFLKDILDKMDFILPSLYTQSWYRFDNWRLKAQEYLSESKRLGGGKPVYAYISPVSFDNMSYIDKSLWRAELEYLYKDLNCDGVVIWFDIAKQNGFSWSDSDEWWIETKEFIKKFVLH